MIRLPKWVFGALLVAPLGCGLNPQPEPPFAEPTFDDTAGGTAGSENVGGAEGDPTGVLGDAGRNEVPVNTPDFGDGDGGAPADAGADAAP